MSKKILIGALLIAAVGVWVVVGRNKPETAPSPSPSVSVSVSPKASPTVVPSVTVSPSRTPTPTPTPTKTPTPSPTLTPTSTPTPTPSPTLTPTPSPTPTPGPQTHLIRIEDFSFYPGTLNVKSGDTVRFTNYDAVDHSPEHDGGDWNTPTLSADESYDLDTEDLAPGTYRYHCGIHGQSMVGTLRIQ